MSLIRAKAKEISDQVYATAVAADRAKFIDPVLLIDIIAEILLEAIKLYQSCNKTPQQAVEATHSAASGSLAGWWTRRRLWGTVKAASLPFSVSGSDVYDAILNAGKGVTFNDMVAIYKGD